MKKIIVVLWSVLFVFVSYCGLIIGTSAAEPTGEKEGTEKTYLTGVPAASSKPTGEKNTEQTLVGKLEIKNSNTILCELQDTPIAEQTLDEKLNILVHVVLKTDIKLRTILLTFNSRCQVPILCDENASEKLDAPVKISTNKPIPLKELLENILKPQGLTYTVTDNIVLISDAGKPNEISEKTCQHGSYRKQPTSGSISERLKESFTCNIKEPVMLNEALEQISKITEINFAVDWTLHKSGAAGKKFHFYFPFKLPLYKALDYLTKQQNLTWNNYDNDYILITEKEQPQNNETKYARTYYVGDLLGNSSRVWIEKGQPDNSIAAETADSFKALIDYITVMVNSEKQEDNIQPYYPNLSLVVRDSIDGHNRITELLAQLRKSNPLSNNTTENDSLNLPSPLISRKPFYYYRQYNISDLVSENTTDATELVNLVTTVVSHDCWKENGGNGMVAVQENRQLLVFQEHEIHSEITDLVKQLRQLNEDHHKK